MSKKIMLADDAKGLKDSISYLITSMMPDVEVEQVENGKDAVAKARCTGKYSLIMMDNAMSEMGGLEALKQIREFDKQTPVIMFSTDNIEEEALKLGARYISKNDFIQRKVSILDVYKLLEKYLT